MTGTHRRGQAGGASILVLGIGMCVLLVAAMVVGLGAATAARHRAQAAADASALAGAAWVLFGEHTACASAARLAAANDATMTGCRISGMTLTVDVAVDVAGLPAGLGPARAAATAGPVMVL